MRTHGEQGRSIFLLFHAGKAGALGCVRLSPTNSLGSVSSSLRARATDEIVIFSAVPLFSRLVTMFRRSLSLSLSLSRSKTFSSYPNPNACKGMEHDV